MEEEFYTVLDKYDFSKLLTRLRWIDGLNDLDKIRRMAPREDIKNKSAIEYAINSLDDKELMRYFKNCYWINFKRGVSTESIIPKPFYTVVIITHFNNGSLKRITCKTYKQ